MKFDQHLAWVEFDQRVQTKGDEDVLGFEVAGKDRVFHPAMVMIQRKAIAVRSDEVKEVVAVRYAWANDPKANLMNKEGLPVSPFRSDDWPVGEDQKK